MIVCDQETWIIRIKVFELAYVNGITLTKIKWNA